MCAIAHACLCAYVLYPLAITHAVTCDYVFVRGNSNVEIENHFLSGQGFVCARACLWAYMWTCTQVQVCVCVCVCLWSV